MGIQKNNGSMAGSDIYIWKRLGNQMKLVSAFAAQNGKVVTFSLETLLHLNWSSNFWTFLSKISLTTVYIFIKC